MPVRARRRRALARVASLPSRVHASSRRVANKWHQWLRRDDESASIESDPS
jgi:hypothetical protein